MDFAFPGEGWQARSDIQQRVPPVQQELNCQAAAYSSASPDLVTQPLLLPIDIPALSQLLCINLHMRLYHTVTLSSHDSWATSDQKGETWPLLFHKSVRKPALKADIQTPQFTHADCSRHPKAKSTSKKGQNSHVYPRLWATSLGQPYTKWF